MNGSNKLTNLLPVQPKHAQWLLAYRHYLHNHIHYAAPTQKAYSHDAEQLLCNMQKQHITLPIYIDKVFLRMALRNYRPATRARKLASWRHFLGWLAGQQRVAPPVVLQPIQTTYLPPKLPRWLSPQHIQRLLRHLLTVEHGGAKRDVAIFLLLYGAGLRLSEAAALRCDAIDWQRAVLTVASKKPPGRRVYLPKNALRLLQTYHHSVLPQRVYFFAANPSWQRPISVRSMQRHIAQMGKSLGLHLTACLLRHGFTTHLVGANHHLPTAGEPNSAAATHSHPLAQLIDRCRPRRRLLKIT